MDVDLKQIEMIVERLRAMGVVQFENAGLKLTILPQAPAVFESEPEEKPEGQSPVEEKRGPDGLTKDEQREWYGRVLDSEV